MTAWSHQMSLAPRPRAARRPSVRGRRLSFGVAAAALAITTIGLATGSAASAATAAASSSRVVTARTTTTFAMPAPGYNTVQSVTLSAGAWTVIAKATAVNSSTTDFARCQLYDATHSVSLDGATYQVGTTASTGGPITNLATLDVLAGATVQIQQRCGHDGAAGDAAYIDADASLVAFKALGNKSTAQSLTRTTASTVLTTSATTVLSLTLPVGSYAIGFKMTAVTFSGNATVTCSLQTTRGYTGGATLAVGTQTAAATDAFFTYASGGGTLSLGCQLSGAAGAYLDPGTVLWARQAKAVTAVENGCGAYLINGTTDLITVVRPGAVCSFSGETPLSEAYVSKGTWVAVGGESTIFNGDARADFARCELVTTAGGHLDGTAVWEQAPSFVGATLLGAIKLAGQSTFTEQCTRDTSGATSSTDEGSLVLIRP